MMLMALDHVRDYFHIGAHTGDPLDLATTTPQLFFTRWITHFCAPVFIFLSGTSIFLQGRRKTSKELGMFVLKRGCWLILAEWTIVAFGWTFNPDFVTVPFQVIWTIGISMVIMGLLLLMRASYAVFLITGLLIVLGHNTLDSIEAAPGFTAGFWWDLFHSGTFKFYQITGNHYALLIYPFVPWTGLMMLGYCLGKLYTPDMNVEQRKTILLRMGVGLLVFFVLMRFLNMYGDPHSWSTQSNYIFTLLSFVNVNKYPPSLMYLSMTISVALLLLVWLEQVRNKFVSVMVVFGRTAFFYYIAHIYLIHLLSAIVFFAKGHTFTEGLHLTEPFPFLFVQPGEGFDLGITYLVWMGVLVLLYPVCKWYERYKQTHKEYWWLSYL
jgi:uncharacterized membrane protein